MMSVAKAVLQGAKIWMAVRPVRSAQKAVRRLRNKRRERRGLPLLDTEFAADKEFGMLLKGKLSWTGLGVIVLGLVLNVFGVGDCSAEAAAAGQCVPPEALAEHLLAAIDQMLIAVGAIIAARGKQRQALVVYRDETEKEK